MDNMRVDQGCAARKASGPRRARQDLERFNNINKGAWLCSTVAPAVTHAGVMSGMGMATSVRGAWKGETKSGHREGLGVRRVPATKQSRIAVGPRRVRHRRHHHAVDRTFQHSALRLEAHALPALTQARAGIQG